MSSATRAGRRLPAGPSGFEAARFFARGTFDGTPEFLLDLRRRFGPVTQFRLLARRVWIFSEPRAVEDVLVAKHRAFVKSRGSVRLKRLLGDGLLTSEEPLHLRQRHALQPAFHRERVAHYAALVLAEAQAEVADWRGGAAFDVASSMTRLTLAIAARTLFGADVGRNVDEVRGALTEAMELFPRFLSPLSELFDRLPVPSTRRFAAARARLDAIVYGLIRRRRAQRGGEGDFLSMLLRARDAEGRLLADTRVRDEAMTIFLAGHETTANALFWSLYLLSQHPYAAAHLTQEVFAHPESVPLDAARLPYTRAVISEAMRLYPPAWILGRRVMRDVEIAGYALRRGEIALMSQYVVHRDPRYFDEPNTFRPERWLEPRDLPRFAYFPFGGGNRVCIGEAFAWMESVFVLATVARAWRLEIVPGTPVGIQPLVTLRPRYPMPMVPRAAATATANAENLS